MSVRMAKFLKIFYRQLEISLRSQVFGKEVTIGSQGKRNVPDVTLPSRTYKRNATMTSLTKSLEITTSQPTTEATTFRTADQVTQNPPFKRYIASETTTGHPTGTTARTTTPFLTVTEKTTPPYRVTPRYALPVFFTVPTSTARPQTTTRIEDRAEQHPNSIETELRGQRRQRAE